MSTKNDPINTTITESNALVKKYDAHNPRSGEVSALLRARPDGQAMYETVQRSEVGLHAAKKTRDEAYAAYLASRSSKDQLERTIVAMARAADTVEKALGGKGFADVFTADDNDPASIAARIAGDMKAVPFVGQGFEQGLLALRDQLIARESAHQEIATAFVSATRDFGGAYYQAASIVAQAKAFLVVAGVKVNDRKVTKKKKSEKKEEELPVPAPTPMPMAA